MKIKRHLKYFLVVCLYSCAAGDYSTDLGDHYLFVSESNANQFIYNMNDTTGRRSIPCTVEQFKFDERYIVAKQNPNKDCSDKGFNDSISQFYIVDKKRNIEYGPLDSSAYQKKKKLLSITLNL